jgi:hypothetical protein
MIYDFTEKNGCIRVTCDGVLDSYLYSPISVYPQPLGHGANCGCEFKICDSKGNQITLLEPFKVSFNGTGVNPKSLLTVFKDYANKTYKYVECTKFYLTQEKDDTGFAVDEYVCVDNEGNEFPVYVNSGEKPNGIPLGKPGSNLLNPNNFIMEKNRLFGRSVNSSIIPIQEIPGTNAIVVCGDGKTTFTEATPEIKAIIDDFIADYTAKNPPKAGFAYALSSMVATIAPKGLEVHDDINDVDKTVTSEAPAPFAFDGDTSKLNVGGIKRFAFPLVDNGMCLGCVKPGCILTGVEITPADGSALKLEFCIVCTEA